VSHVGVQRLGAGHREHDRGQRENAIEKWSTKNPSA
jgi:hypothetical protein